jgi:hypothetical protein
LSYFRGQKCSACVVARRGKGGQELPGKVSAPVRQPDRPRRAFFASGVPLLLTPTIYQRSTREMSRWSRSQRAIAASKRLNHVTAVSRASWVPDAPQGKHGAKVRFRFAAKERLRSDSERRIPRTWARFPSHGAKQTRSRTSAMRISAPPSSERIASRGPVVLPTHPQQRRGTRISPWTSR